MCEFDNLSSKDKPTVSRGHHIPPVFDPDDMPSLMSPEQMEIMLRAYEACLPKITHHDSHGQPMIWGTGGELPSSTTHTYSMSKAQFKDLFQNPESYDVPPIPPID